MLFLYHIDWYHGNTSDGTVAVYSRSREKFIPKHQDPLKWSLTLAQQFYWFSKETPKWMQDAVSIKTFATMLFKIAKIWKQSSCLIISVGWISFEIHTMDYSVNTKDENIPVYLWHEICLFTIYTHTSYKIIYTSGKCVLFLKVYICIGKSWKRHIKMLILVNSRWYKFLLLKNIVYFHFLICL